MGHVFISYSRGDRRTNPLVNRLIEDLNRSGVRVWLAPDDVEAGANWQEAITQALSWADALLFLGSKRLSKGAGMRRELDAALENNLPVVAVATEEAGLPLVHEVFDKRGVADSTIIELYRDYPNALRRVIERLPASVRDAPPTEADAPKSKGYVFISYAEEDEAFVTRLREFLEDRGYGYWDYRESDRNYHTFLFLELEAVIRNAAAVIAVLSPDWKKSKWTAREYLFSEEVGIPVFLAMVRNLEPTLIIAGLPYIDFVANDAFGFAKLDRELRRKGLI